MRNDLVTPEKAIFTAPATTYSPLVLSYTSPDWARKWELDFQLRPEPKITFHGDDPTTDELVECLNTIYAPMWFIDVCKVAVGVANRVRHET